MISSQPTLHKKVISEEERIILRENALKLLDNGTLKENKAGRNRFFVSYKETNKLHPIHIELYNRITKLLDLTNPIIDPVLGLIISVIKPGGYIHPHTDSYANNNFLHLKEKRNIRFNVMINRENDISYDPHISNNPLHVDICDGWCFSASELIHSTPKINGKEFRIVYQFGFCVD